MSFTVTMTAVAICLVWATMAAGETLRGRTNFADGMAAVFAVLVLLGWILAVRSGVL